jgi:hypothetical protein
MENISEEHATLQTELSRMGIVDVDTVYPVPVAGERGRGRIAHVGAARQYAFYSLIAVIRNS